MGGDVQKSLLLVVERGLEREGPIRSLNWILDVLGERIVLERLGQEAKSLGDRVEAPSHRKGGTGEDDRRPSQKVLTHRTRYLHRRHPDHTPPRFGPGDIVLGQVEPEVDVTDDVPRLIPDSGYGTRLVGEVVEFDERLREQFGLASGAT